MKKAIVLTAVVLMSFGLFLMSCENEAALQNLLEIAQSTDELDSLVNVILYVEEYAEVDPEIVESLADTSLLFTVFAPTNDAFVEVFGDLDEDGIVENEDIRNELGPNDADNAGYLGEILGLHVIEDQKLFVADIKSDADGTIGPTAYDEEGTVYLNVTVEGEEVTLRPSPLPASASTTIDSTNNDIEASNGVVHFVDTVMRQLLA